MQNRKSIQVANTLDYIWESHREHVLRLLMGLTRDTDLAEDLTQETYLHASAGFPGYRGGDARAWLVAIAKNVFYAYVRRKSFRSESLADVECVADPKYNPGASDSLMVIELRKAIENLDPSLRSALVLRHYGGYSYLEIAERLDCPEGTAKWRVSEALSRLKEALAGTEGAEDNLSYPALSGTTLLDHLYGALADGIGAVDKLARNLVNSGTDPGTDLSPDADTDPRLAGTVCYKARHRKLRLVLRDLSSQFGVPLKAGENYRDWLVRERRMNIFVTDISLAGLMESIARVLRFKWTQSGSGYALVVDRDLLMKAGADYRVKKDELKRQLRERRLWFLDELARLDAMPDAETERLRETNPYLYLSKKTGLARAATAVFKDLPELRELFACGEQNLNPLVSLFSPETRKLLTDGLRAYWPYGRLDYPTDTTFPYDLEADPGEFQSGMEAIPRPLSDWVRRQLTFFGGIGCGTHQGYYMLGYFMDPWCREAQLFAKRLLMRVDEGLTEEEVRGVIGVEMNAAYLDACRFTDRYLPMETPLDHPDDPVLLRTRVRIPHVRRGGRHWSVIIRDRFADAQEAVSEALGVSIISDSFASVFAYSFSESEAAEVISGDVDSTGLISNFASSTQGAERSVQDILNDFADWCLYNWEKRGSVIEFRHRDWFVMRTAQIPEECIKAWREAVQRKGGMTLDEFSQFGSLTYEQIGENILTDPVLGRCTAFEDWNVANNRALLRFYTSLSPIQREQLFSESGLDLNTLPPAQWQLAVYMFHYGNCFAWNRKRFLEEQGHLLTMTARANTKDGNATSYVFIVSASTDSVPPHDWYVQLPQV